MAGPAAIPRILSPFLELAALGYRVVRYDQLGSWRSDQPDDDSLWRVPRFVTEVERVRQALDLGRMHMLGQSWGAFLAIEYALHHGQHLRSLVLASGRGQHKGMCRRHGQLAAGAFPGDPGDSGAL